MSLHLHQLAAPAAQADARLSVEERHRLEQYLWEILGALGLNVSAEDTQRTPGRLGAWLDATSGYFRRKRARRGVHGRCLSSASIASCRCSRPNDTSWMTPLTKNVGVERTLLRIPPSMCSWTRCR